LLNKEQTKNYVIFGSPWINEKVPSHQNAAFDFMMIRYDFEKQKFII